MILIRRKGNNDINVKIDYDYDHNDDDLGLEDATADMSEKTDHYPEEGKQ